MNPLSHDSPSSFRQRLKRLKWLFSEFGLWGGCVYLANRYGLGFGGEIGSLHPRHVRHPLSFRRGASDINVMGTIFLDQEYAPLLGQKNVKLVVDCGANVGYSSAYFLSQFPDCNVIAVEPDPGNAEMLRKNLAPYGDRAKVIEAGIWSRSVPLVLQKNQFRDGREWSIQVRECNPGETPDLEAVGIDWIIERSGFNAISVLKIDIEGAEVVLFRENIGWLDRVQSLAIELHDDSSFGNGSEVFYSAIQGRGFDVTQSAELTLCWRQATLS